MNEKSYLPSNYPLLSCILSLPLQKHNRVLEKATQHLHSVPSILRSFMHNQGYQSINWYYPNQSAQLFYQLFAAYSINPIIPSDSTPLIIWLQGGPGSSSELGAFTELGPIRINNGVPELFENSWNKHGHLLFIDSPLNAGFSFYGEREGKEQVSTTEESTDHLMNFLYNFYS